MTTDNVVSALKICTQCVLPETFPGVSFDEDGICNFCNDKKKVSDPYSKADYRDKFKALVRECQGMGAYDILMCYSGGKDSTHTLAILKEEYRLNILAVSVDNGFVSQQAIKNIQTIVEKLGIDHIFFRPRHDMLIKVFRWCADKDIFPPKALEKASSICTACMAFVKYATLRMALEKEIPFIAYGWSPGQAPITSSIIRTSPQMIKFIQRSLYDPLYRVAGSDIRPYFLENRHFEGSFRFPFYVHPLAFLDYNEEEIYRNIKRLEWVKPEDVDSNSTNCLLNCFGNVVHKKRLGFHPYSFELANLVRNGYLERQTALARLNQPENLKILAMVRSKLSMEEETHVD